MPLNRPTNFSSRTIVPIACKVEWYLPANVGFWNLTFTDEELLIGHIFIET